MNRKSKTVLQLIAGGGTLGILLSLSLGATAVGVLGAGLGAPALGVFAVGGIVCFFALYGGYSLWKKDE